MFDIDLWVLNGVLDAVTEDRELSGKTRNPAGRAANSGSSVPRLHSGRDRHNDWFEMTAPDAFPACCSQVIDSVT
jgi:hypothetical protein